MTMIDVTGVLARILPQQAVLVGVNISGVATAQMAHHLLFHLSNVRSRKPSPGEVFMHFSQLFRFASACDLLGEWSRALVLLDEMREAHGRGAAVRMWPPSRRTLNAERPHSDVRRLVWQGGGAEAPKVQIDRRRFGDDSDSDIDLDGL